MTALSIETANFLIVMFSIFGVYSAITWRRGGKINNNNREAIEAWIWIFASVGISAGWFAISRDTAPPAVNFNPDMYEWRWLVKTLVALAFGWGMLKFIGLIEGYSARRKIGFCAVFFMISLIMGIF